MQVVARSGVLRLEASRPQDARHGPGGGRGSGVPRKHPALLPGGYNYGPGGNHAAELGGVFREAQFGGRT